MKDKDLIEIQDINGNKRQVELVLKFNLDCFDNNYIIYRELDYSHTYIAKYIGEDIVNLDTNLTTKEFEMAKLFYEGVNKHGTK